MLSSLSNPIFLTVVVFGAGVTIAGLAAYLFIYATRQSKEDKFEKESLEKMIYPFFRKQGSTWGSVNGSVLRKDMRDVGIVTKDMTIKAKPTHGDGTEKEDQDKSYIEKDKLENLLDQTSLPEEVKDAYNKIENKGSIDCKLLEVRNKGVIGSYMYFLGELLNNSAGRNYMVIPEEHIESTPETIIIDKDLEIVPFAGLWIAKSYPAFEVLKSAVYKQLYETSLEDQANYHRQVHNFASQHKQELEKLEKLYNLRNNKYGEGLKDDLEDD